jgi:hypothetical protein
MIDPPLAGGDRKPFKQVERFFTDSFFREQD